MILAGDPLALRKLNERNARFWFEQSKLTSKRMSDEILFRIATNDMQSDLLRGVPAYWQKTIDQTLADAAAGRKAFHTWHSHTGGIAPKSDALQTLIEEVAKKNLAITTRQLLNVLEGDAGAGIITSIDGPSDGLAGVREIHFVEEDGREKTAPLSGLKDRLYRAKKKIKANSR